MVLFLLCDNEIDYGGKIIVVFGKKIWRLWTCLNVLKCGVIIHRQIMWLYVSLGGIVYEQFENSFINKISYFL